MDWDKVLKLLDAVLKCREVNGTNNIAMMAMAELYKINLEIGHVELPAGMEEEEEE